MSLSLKDKLKNSMSMNSKSTHGHHSGTEYFGSMFDQFQRRALET